MKFLSGKFNLVVGLFFFSLFGLLSLWIGQDANFDLFLYHYWNGFGILHGLFGKSYILSPQEYFNPILDVLFYSLYYFLPVRLAGFFLGGVHGICAFLIFLIVKHIFSSFNQTRLNFLAFFIALVSVFSSRIFISELGTSFHDNTLAVFQFGSLLLFIRFLHEKKERDLILAAILIGIPVGLKLTTLIFAGGLSFTLLFIMTFYPAYRKFKLIALWGFGILSGFLSVHGYWMMRLSREFESSFFPVFNKIFRSPNYSLENFTDPRFLPKNFFEFIFYPFVFASNHMRISEIGIPNRNFACLYAVVLVFAGSFCLDRFRHKTLPRVDAAPMALFVFFLSSYFVWIIQFGILRYVVLLDLLIPLLIAFFVSRLDWKREGKIILVCILLIVSFRKYTVNSWGRAPWVPNVLESKLPENMGLDEKNIIVFRTDHTHPISYLYSAFPLGTRFVRIDSHLVSEFGPLQRRVLNETRGFQGSFYYLKTPISNDVFLDQIKFAYSPSECKPMVLKQSNFPGALLCPVTKKE